MNTERIVLGIDPGLATVGYGLVRFFQDKPLLIDFGTITTAPGLPSSERLRTIEHDLHDLIVSHTPTEAYVEELFFSTNTKTAISVAEARGVIMSTLARFDLNPKGITPNQVKLAVTGDGSADKRQVQDMLSIIFNLSSIPQPDDAADAVAIALGGASLHFTP